MSRNSLRKLSLSVLGVLLAACTTPGTDGESPATIPGKPVSEEMFAILVEAAHVCPELTPARIAGQVMAESSFAADVTNGVAGLSDEDWKAWQPSPEANRTDPRSSIIALTRLMCNLVGREKAAGADGNAWWLAVSAYRSGKRPTVSASDVAPPIRAYADRVAAHAAWYETQPNFDAYTLTSSLAGAQSPTASAMPSASPKSTEGSKQPSPKITKAKAPPRPPNLRDGAALFNEEFDRCLSATRSLDGTHLSMANCNGSDVQRWTAYPDGTIRAVGLCMDVANAITDDFTPVQVAYCSGNPAQQFVLEGDHLRSTYANKCVNVHADESVVIYKCVAQSNQRWKLR